MRVALCWACGIGSLLALDALAKQKHDVTLLHVLPPADAWRAVPDFVVEEQAACLGLPLHVERVRGHEGETGALTRALAHVRADAVAFGYLRGEDYLGMFKVANASRGGGAEPMLPVRHVRPDDAAHALAAAGHRVFVRAVSEDAPRELLGRFLDAAAVEDVEGALGRGGWSSLHTLAVDGPLFARRCDAAASEPERAAGGWRLALSLKGC